MSLCSGFGKPPIAPITESALGCILAVQIPVAHNRPCFQLGYRRLGSFRDAETRGTLLGPVSRGNRAAWMARAEDIYSRKWQHPATTPMSKRITRPPSVAVPKAGQERVVLVSSDDWIV